MGAKNKFDLIVVGGGVMGTFHAYHALKKGLKVALFEKDKEPRSATVRNFGMVVPSGMSSKWQKYGIKSLEIYKELQSKVDLTIRECGQVYIASNEEEMTLINELHAINQRNNYPSTLLNTEEVLSRYPRINPGYALGGLFFPEEVLVEPREMIHRLQEYLVSEMGLEVHIHQLVKKCEVDGKSVKIVTAAGDKFTATHAIVANGSDFQTLFPEIFAKSDIDVVKLQMLQTAAQPEDFKLPSGVLSGFSIRRYEAFEECPSFHAIKGKEDDESLAKKWGVNILFKQALDGSIVIGDSHEYASVKDAADLGFDNHDNINNYMLEEAKKIYDLPTYDIEKRWVGIYSQTKDHGLFEQTIDGRIHIVTAIGGKGMTVSAGYSEEKIASLEF